jgi:alpha-tubulin suppressor-like RCC1 family protein
VTCSHTNEPEIDKVFPEQFTGQLDSDIDNAILKKDGTLWTWGSNLTGQLGYEINYPVESPLQIKTLRNIVAVDLFEGAGIAADIKGNVWFWGNRIIWEEPLGFDTTIILPKNISNLTDIIQIQIFGTFIHLLRNDGTVWRLNWNHNFPYEYLYPEKIEGLENIKMITMNLALKKDGTLCTFPDRRFIGMEYGGLGDKIINDVEEVQNVSMSYTIILKKDSTVWAWGKNKGGYLGNSTFIDNPVPTRIDKLKEIVSISANNSRCLALNKDGEVWFWGLIGENSIDSLKYQNKPLKINTLNNLKLIFASPVWDLLFMKNDSSYWGYNVQTNTLNHLKF